MRRTRSELFSRRSVVLQRSAACLLIFFALAGCEPVSPPTRIQLTTFAGIEAEIDRVSTTLKQDRAAEFAFGAKVFALHTSETARTRVDTWEAAEKVVIDALNGKTADEVMAEYRKLSPEIKKLRGEQLKAVMEATETADLLVPLLARIDELESDEATKHIAKNLRDTFGKKLTEDGRAAAAKWLSEQMKDSSTEQLRERFGTVGKSN